MTPIPAALRHLTAAQASIDGALVMFSGVEWLEVIRGDVEAARRVLEKVTMEERHG